VSIEVLNDLALRLVAEDFSNGHKPSQGGPTKTSRALAIIHLAAHDAYMLVTTKFDPVLKAGLPPLPGGVSNTDAAGTDALLAAGCRAALELYPDFQSTIRLVRDAAEAGADPKLVTFGIQVAEAWLAARSGDNSALPQEDSNYIMDAGHHRPDPFNPSQMTLGRMWGKVTPFILTDVTSDTDLEKYPNLDGQEYALAYDQVFVNGNVDLTERDTDSRHMAAVGIFWAYDGANRLGTPPRLYNKVVREISEVQALPHEKRVRVYAAVNAAMADAGIAAWHWKYKYDLWRPVVAIREADAGWGPTGTGDGNTLRGKPGDPFWRPLGAPRSNPFPAPTAGGPGDNFTPNFPAYPSGHATFGAACFKTVAKLLEKTPQTVTVTFISGEFDGTTSDNKGVARPKWVQTFTLAEAIRQNNLSRIFLGVHWIFDATGGEKVGTQVSEKVSAAFKLA
jgi:hypothetical protein